MNKNEATKRLQKLVEKRKSSIIITEQGFVNKKPRSYGSSSCSDYYGGSSEDT